MRRDENQREGQSPLISTDQTKTVRTDGDFRLGVEREDDVLHLRLGGAWRVGERFPDPTAVEETLRESSGIRAVRLDGSGLESWDSLLLTFLVRLERRCAEEGITVRTADLPEGVRRLLDMADLSGERLRAPAPPDSLLARLGLWALERGHSFRSSLGFLGEATLSCCRLLIGRARFRKVDLLLHLQESGARALPIVTLISLLVGLILAFIGAVQLRLFGAEIYIANLVGLAMARDMGAMMTAIIMAGRTGAAYAAQLGTMQGNDEIDAFRTLGISPVDYLVLPRLLALSLMVPLLTVYSDFMGILGGAMVGIGVFEITPARYLAQTREAVALNHFWVGLAKSGAYGVIVALAGCLRGMQCGRSAAEVGRATTSAVVTAIVGIILCCAALTVVFHVLGV